MTFNRGFPATSGSLDSLPIRQNFEHLLDTAITHASSSANPHSVTLDQAFDIGKIIDGANSEANAVRIGDGTYFVDMWADANFIYWKGWPAAGKNWYIESKTGLRLESTAALYLICSNDDIWFQGATARWIKTWNVEGIDIQNVIFLNRHTGSYAELYMKAGGAENPSVVRLQTGVASPVDYYLWVDCSGSLRLYTSYPTDEDADGQIVGPFTEVDTLDSVCERGATTDQPITVTGSGSVFKSLNVVNDLQVGGDLIADHNTLSNLQGGQANEYYHLKSAEHTALVGGATSDADAYHVHPSSGSGGAETDTLDDVCERGAETDVAITVTASGSVFKSLRVQNDLHIGGDLEVDDNAVVDGHITVLSSGSVLNSLKVDNNVHIYGDLIASAIDATMIADGSISNGEFEYLNGVNANIQNSLNAKAENLLQLTDTPANYTGAGLKIVRVNIAADGLEFVSSGSGGVETDTLDDVCERGAETDVAITVTASGSVFKSLRVQNDLHIGGDLEVDDNAVVDGHITVLSSGSAIKALKIDDNLHVYGDLIIEGSGGAAGTKYILLPIDAATLPDDSTGNKMPAIERKKSSAGAPSPHFMQALFDDSTEEFLYWSFRMPGDYGSGLTAKIQYKMVSATSGNVDFDVALMAVTPGDSQDVDADSMGAVNSGDETVPGTTGYLSEISITLSNADSLAAGDYVVIYLKRDADDGSNDTATGEAEVVSFSLSYTPS